MMQELWGFGQRQQSFGTSSCCRALNLSVYIKPVVFIEVREEQLRLAAVSGLLNLGIIAALMYITYYLADAEPHPVLTWRATAWNSLVAATWVSLALAAAVLFECVAAWRSGSSLWAARVYYTVAAAVTASFIPFVFYWDLLRPTWYRWNRHRAAQAMRKCVSLQPVARHWRPEAGSLRSSASIR